MAITVTTGYQQQPGGLVTPTRLNQAITGLTMAATQRRLLGTGTTLTAVTEIAYTDAGLVILQAADAAAQRTALGLGSLATKNAVNNGDWSGTALSIPNGGTGATDAAGARTALGLGTAATQPSTAFDAAGAATAAQAASLQKSSNLSDLSNVATARTNLGLGTAATQPSTAFDAAGAAAAAQAASLQKSSNLSDLTNAATARTNLGLGSLATASAVNDSNWSGTALAIGHGGTGATSASAARTALGLGTAAVKNITISASAPSGGADGDLWGQYV